MVDFSSLLREVFFILLGHSLVANVNIIEYIFVLLLDLVKYLHIVLELLQIRLFML